MVSIYSVYNKQVAERGIYTQHHTPLSHISALINLTVTKIVRVRQHLFHMNTTRRCGLEIVFIY